MEDNSKTGFTVDEDDLHISPDHSIEATIMMRPMMDPTYSDIWSIPDWSEIIMFAGDNFRMYTQGDGLRATMKEAIDGTGMDPDMTIAATLALWVHPDDMDPEKLARIKALG